MKTCFYFILSLLPFIASAQTYSTSTQGSNNSAGGAYVAPIITKSYTVPSSGYKPAQATISYNTFKYNSSNISSDKQIALKEEELGTRTNPGIYMEGGRYGISDMYGKRITNPIYEDAKYFNWAPISKGSSYWSGTIMVKSAGKWGLQYPDASALIIPVMYDQIKKIDNWTAWVKSGEKVGLITFNVTGSAIGIPVMYDEIGALADDAYTWVRTGNKYGLYNTSYRQVLRDEYDAINKFSTLTLIVMNNKKYGLADYAGYFIVPIDYDYITPPADGMAWILKDGKWGLITEGGVVKAAPQYDSLYQQKDGALWINNIAVVSKNGKVIYVNKSGEDISLNTARVTKMEEHFDSGNIYKWPAFENCSIKDGHYEISPTFKYSYIRKIPFPKEIMFTAKEDWLLELSIRKVNGIQSVEMGIMIESPDLALSTFFISSNGDGSRALVDVRFNGIKNIYSGEPANKEFNTIKLIRKGNEIKAFFNNKVVGKGKLKDEDVTDGRFYLRVQEPSLANDNATFYFDDVHFEILK